MFFAMFPSILFSTLHNRPNDFRPLLIAEGHYSILVSDYYSARMISGFIQNFSRRGSI